MPLKTVTSSWRVQVSKQRVRQRQNYTGNALIYIMYLNDFIAFL